MIHQTKSECKIYNLSLTQAYNLQGDKETLNFKKLNFNIGHSEKSIGAQSGTTEISKAQSGHSQNTGVQLGYSEKSIGAQSGFSENTASQGIQRSVQGRSQGLQRVQRRSQGIHRTQGRSQGLVRIQGLSQGIWRI